MTTVMRSSASRQKVYLKNPKKHTPSSQRWLTRQLNDPYVSAAKEQGYRSRAAFKLKEIDDKFKIFHPHQRVLDLGCAPGGWLQVVSERTGLKKADSVLTIIGVDLLETLPIPGAHLIQGDFLNDEILQHTLEILGGKADVVLTDMAACTTGHVRTDHLKIMALLEAALNCAEQVLRPGGSFVGKIFQGGTENSLLKRLKQLFTKVSHFKPKSSRKDSAEMYVVATGFIEQIGTDTLLDTSGEQ